MAKSPLAYRNLISYFVCGWFLLAAGYAYGVKELIGLGWSEAIQESAWTWAMLLPGAVFCFRVARVVFTVRNV